MDTFVKRRYFNRDHLRVVRLVAEELALTAWRILFNLGQVHLQGVGRLDVAGPPSVASWGAAESSTGTNTRSLELRGKRAADTGKKLPELQCRLQDSKRSGSARLAKAANGML